MAPIRLYAINTDAGPPLERDLPEATKRPVPVCGYQYEARQLHDEGHTDGPSDSYHLQMSSLQLPGQWRIRSGLSSGFGIEDGAIGANDTARGDSTIGIPPEAVDDTTRNVCSWYYPVIIDGLCVPNAVGIKGT